MWSLVRIKLWTLALNCNDIVKIAVLITLCRVSRIMPAQNNMDKETKYDCTIVS